MKNTIIFLFALIIASCTNKKEGIAITNVSIIDVKSGLIIENQTLLIEGSKIFKIESSNKTSIPNGYEKVNGSGKFLIPGLWDMHVHTSSEDITRDILLPLFIANGITGVRIMAADCFEPCWDLDLTITQTRKLQLEVDQDKIIGPKTILSSFYINETLPDSSSIQAPLTAKHGRELVHLLKQRNVDFIKIYDDIPREAYLALADEASKIEFDFAGHVPFDMKTSEVSKLGQKSIEHCCDFNLFRECSALEQELRDELINILQGDKVENLSDYFLKLAQTFDSTKCNEIYKLFVENKTWFVPTLRHMEVYHIEAPNWRDNPNIKYMPVTELEFYEERDKEIRIIMGYPYEEINQLNRQIVKDMNQAGVGLLAGSDCGETGMVHGFSLHEELESIVKAGLSPLEALQTATINPAQFLNATDSLGKIEVGTIADLILLDANPLKNISNTKKINSVISEGRLYRREKLDSILLSIENKAKDKTASNTVYN